MGRMHQGASEVLISRAGPLFILFNRKLRSLLNKNAPLWMRTPRLRKLFADAAALRRECAQEHTLF